MSSHWIILNDFPPTVKSMVKEMDWCYRYSSSFSYIGNFYENIFPRNKISYDQSSNLQNCVLHSSKVIL